jgi:hypothetical protein
MRVIRKIKPEKGKTSEHMLSYNGDAMLPILVLGVWLIHFHLFTIISQFSNLQSPIQLLMDVLYDTVSIHVIMYPSIHRYAVCMYPYLRTYTLAFCC